MNVLEHVRIATLSDLPKLMDFAKEFHKESPYRDLKFSYAKTWESYKNVISGDRLNAIVLIAVDGETPVGMVAAIADSPVFSEEKISTELCWFISKKYRNSRKAFILFQAYEEWAKRIGCDHIQSAFLLEGESQANLDKFYSKKGYRPIEVSYIKEV